MPTRGQMFPDIAVSDYTRQPEILQKRIEVPWGDPQINQPHPFVVQHIRFNSEWFTPADVDALEAWFLLNSTTYFSIYENAGWATRAIPKETFALVVAGQMSYTIPAKELAGVIVYDDTLNQVILASKYSLAAGAGAEGETVLTFVAGQLPPAGRYLSYSATGGRRKFTVWCENETFPQAHTGEGDLFTLEEPLRFRSRMVTS